MRSPEYFARFVLEATNRMDRVVCWEQGGPHGSLIWPEMGDAQWRDAALSAIKSDDRITSAQFVEPTPEIDWTFLAVRRGASKYAH